MALELPTCLLPLLLLAATLPQVSLGFQCAVKDAAKGKESASTVICGLPLAAHVSPPNLPFACSRKADDVSDLVSEAAGSKSMSDAQICFQLFESADAAIVDFSAKSLEEKGYGNAKSLRVQLHRSVSELVGTSAGLALKGDAIHEINPEIFQEIGPTQREKLKTLLLIKTSLTSLDLSLLRSLNVGTLSLVENQNLTQLFNWQGAALPDLKSVHLVLNNESLIDCRNLRELPQTVEKLIFLHSATGQQLSDAQSCAMCELPASVAAVFVSDSVTALPHRPEATKDAASFEMFPLTVTELSNLDAGEPRRMNSFSLTGSSAAASCQKKCQCLRWTSAKRETTATTAAASKAATVSQLSVIISSLLLSTMKLGFE